MRTSLFINNNLNMRREFNTLVCNWTSCILLPSFNRPEKYAQMSRRMNDKLTFLLDNWPVCVAKSNRSHADFDTRKEPVTISFSNWSKNYSQTRIPSGHISGQWQQFNFITRYKSFELNNFSLFLLPFLIPWLSCWLENHIKFYDSNRMKGSNARKI